jgi:hypothetical protein
LKLASLSPFNQDLVSGLQQKKLEEGRKERRKGRQRERGRNTQWCIIEKWIKNNIISHSVEKRPNLVEENGRKIPLNRRIIKGNLLWLC